MMTEEGQQESCGRGTRELAESIVLSQVGVVLHPLCHDHRQAVCLGHQANGRTFHFEAAHLPYRFCESGKDLSIFDHLITTRERSDMNPKISVRGWPIWVDGVLSIKICPALISKP
jgi:hypothetical protein